MFFPIRPSIVPLTFSPEAFRRVSPATNTSTSEIAYEVENANSSNDAGHAKLLHTSILPLRPKLPSETTQSPATKAPTPAIAVSIEETPPAERLDLYARVIGLTARETELLRGLAAGSTTKQLAGRLYVSEHTVQDHCKAMFAKAGVSSRRLLVARSTGSA